MLQSYRSLHLTFQSIALAIGIGLFVVITSFDFGRQFKICLLLFLSVWILQLFATLKFKKIVSDRGNDVNFWHCQIILAEQELQSDRRYFTMFKIYQKLSRDDSSHLREFFLSNRKISQEDAEILIEKGLGHTRKVINEQLFYGISSIWLFMVLAGIILVVYKVR